MAPFGTYLWNDPHIPSDDALAHEVAAIVAVGKKT